MEVNQAINYNYLETMNYSEINTNPIDNNRKNNIQMSYYFPENTFDDKEKTYVNENVGF